MNTEVYTGYTLAPGYADGVAFTYNRLPPNTTGYTSISPDQISREMARLNKALHDAVEEIKDLRKRAFSEIGQAETAVFDAHLTLLTDPTISNKIRSRLNKDLVNVEKAIADEISEHEKALGRIESENLRERYRHALDVGQRLFQHLKSATPPQKATLQNLPSRCIIVAKELLPSDTLHLDRDHTIGVVTAYGGKQSHAAILARSLGIPFVTGIKDILENVKNGDRLLVDSTKATVTISPTPEQKTSFRKKQQESIEHSRTRSAEQAYECRTLDGTEYELFANIDRPEELPYVERYHLHGVGLFRTEYLFLETPQPPSLAKQAHVYAQCAQKLQNRPLTIRTADLGADKQPRFLTQTDQKDPHQRVRGLQLVLAQRNLLRTQLRAALRARWQGNAKVMFPMVLGPADLDLQETLDELHFAAEQEGVTTLPEIGAMIETPSAVAQIDDICEMVDFISIGVNDLTQFVLGSSRWDLSSVPEFSALNPAVLQAIHTVIQGARKQSKPCYVCGEIAGDPSGAYLLLGLGIRQLSMSSVRASKIHYMLRRTRVREAEETAVQALRCRSEREVHAFVDPITEGIT